MKKFIGKAENISEPILGIITRNPLSIMRANNILVVKDKSLFVRGFAGIITQNPDFKNNSLPTIKIPEKTLDELSDGDYVLIDNDGIATIIWEKNSRMNPILLTEMCDCRCIMCPQPPKKHDKNLIEIAKKILNSVRIEYNQTICLTGGEPTLLKEDFFEILNLISKKHRKSFVMLLTNGKSFADFSFTKHFIASRPKEFITCVSIHSDIDEIHDMIVGAKGSFYKTAMGLQNLARFRERIEIRVVINSLNFNRLESIATFIWRNFPFITHCAFMGMEITGLARDNYDSIWIDPYNYRFELARAIDILNRADINVSAYNIPLCLLEKKSWSFAKQSISEWKNGYIEICDTCSVKSECAGIFTTSELRQSSHISPK